MTDFRIQHHFSAGVYVKQMHLDANHCVDTHQHAYDHFGLLGKGSVIVELDGECETYVAPCLITIKAGKTHKITALTAIDWFCIHATDETDPAKVDAVLINEVKHAVD